MAVFGAEAAIFGLSQVVWEGPGFGGPGLSCSLRAVPDVLSLTSQFFHSCFHKMLSFARECVTLVQGEMKFGFPGGFSGVVRAVA